MKADVNLSHVFRSFVLSIMQDRDKMRIALARVTNHVYLPVREGIIAKGADDRT